MSNYICGDCNWAFKSDAAKPTCPDCGNNSNILPGRSLRSSRSAPSYPIPISSLSSLQSRSTLQTTNLAMRSGPRVGNPVCREKDCTTRVMRSKDQYCPRHKRQKNRQKLAQKEKQSRLRKSRATVSTSQSSSSVTSVPLVIAPTFLTAFAMNAQGKSFCSFQYVINYCHGEKIDIFFVTEPPPDLRSAQQSLLWRLLPIQISSQPEYLAIIYNSGRALLETHGTIHIGGNKSAIYTEFKVLGSRRVYRISAAHIDYSGGKDDVASSGLIQLFNDAVRRETHIVMGDLNVYAGISTSTSSRSSSRRTNQNTFQLCVHSPDSGLDRAYYNSNLFTDAPEGCSKLNCIGQYHPRGSAATNDDEDDAISFRPRRQAAINANDRNTRRSDHKYGVYVRLPCSEMSSGSSAASSSDSSGPICQQCGNAAILFDGLCNDCHEANRDADMDEDDEKNQ